MLRFDIITIFPHIFDSFLKESFIARAQKKKLIEINVHDLRKWVSGRHKMIAETSSRLSPRSSSRRSVVDDRPFGGGLGMVIKVEPVYRAVSTLISNFQFPISKQKRKKTKIILFTPRGKQFNQQMAYKLSKLNRIIMICGRYEGVDERVAKKIADMELSIGDYDLMGGDLPAQVVMETVARLIPGVLGKPELLKERITKEKGFIEYPQYTRPEVFEPRRGVKWRVPKVLISGHHKKIAQWREKKRKIISSCTCKRVEK